MSCNAESSLESVEKISPQVKGAHGDITDSGSLDEFFKDSKGAVLIHLASLIHPTKGIKQLFDVNVNGTRNILNKAIENGVKRIILISSNSPAGTNPSNDHLFDEESPYNPYLSYGKSKMEMELLVKEANSKGDIESVIFRPCWFYGPEQPERQTMFFSMIKDGGALIIGSGESKRSMSYIDNTCQAILLALDNQAANGQTYWITDESPYTMNMIVDTIEELLENEFGYKVAHKRLNLPNMASSVAYIIDSILQKFGLYHQKIHVLSEMNKTIACSINKAKKDLGYDPKISLKEGMRHSIKWCLENGHSI